MEAWLSPLGRRLYLCLPVSSLHLSCQLSNFHLLALPWVALKVTCEQAQTYCFPSTLSDFSVVTFQLLGMVSVFLQELGREQQTPRVSTTSK